MTNSLAHKVRINAKLAYESKKHDSSYLKSGTELDACLTLTAEAHPITRDLFHQLKLDTGYKQDKRFETLQIILANLLNRRGKTPVAISLNKNTYVHSNMSYDFVKTTVDSMETQNLIDKRKGYRFGDKNAEYTKIWPTDELKDLFPRLDQYVIWVPHDVIELRDKDGKPKKFPNTPKIRTLRKKLDLINEVNSKAEILSDGTDVLRTYLHAIYTESFEYYGRLHSKGYRHYQGYSEDDRRSFTINGNPVVELDYKGLHPYLLYAHVGKQYWQDPYSIIDTRPEVRPFLKRILLAMVNSKLETAEKASNRIFFDPQSDSDRRLAKALRKIGINRARPHIDKFLEVHQPIRHLLGTGKTTGLKFMNKDAKIALDVMTHFAKQGIPILSIHDSFIVECQYKTELENVMKSVYRTHTGMRIRVD
jgi:hypothetical protein